MDFINTHLAAVNWQVWSLLTQLSQVNVGGS